MHTHYTHTYHSFSNRVENYRVQKNGQGMVTVDGDDYFNNLIELVEVREMGGTICVHVMWILFAIATSHACNVRVMCM